MQAADPRLGELVANVVELAIELGDRPAETSRGLTARRDLDAADRIRSVGSARDMTNRRWSGVRGMFDTVIVSNVSSD